MWMIFTLETEPSVVDWLAIRERLITWEVKIRLSDPLRDIRDRFWAMAAVYDEGTKSALLGLLSKFGLGSIRWFEIGRYIPLRGRLITVSPVVVREFSPDGNSFCFHPLYHEFWGDLREISVLSYDARFVSLRMVEELLEAWYVEVDFTAHSVSKVLEIVRRGWGNWDGGLGMVVPYDALEDMGILL